MEANKSIISEMKTEADEYTKSRGIQTTFTVKQKRKKNIGLPKSTIISHLFTIWLQHQNTTTIASTSPPHIETTPELTGWNRPHYVTMISTSVNIAIPQSSMYTTTYTFKAFDILGGICCVHVLYFTVLKW